MGPSNGVDSYFLCVTWWFLERKWSDNQGALPILSSLETGELLEASRFLVVFSIKKLKNLGVFWEVFNALGFFSIKKLEKKGGFDELMPFRRNFSTISYEKYGGFCPNPRKGKANILSSNQFEDQEMSE